MEKNNNFVYVNEELVNLCREYRRIMDDLSNLRLQSLSSGYKIRKEKMLLDELNMTREEIINQHKPEIKPYPNGSRFYTRINGRLVTRVKEEDLQNYLVEYYLAQTRTLTNIYDEFIADREKTRSAETVNDDKHYWKTYLQNTELVNIDMTTITRGNIQSWFSETVIQYPHTKKYYKNVLSTLSALFNYACNHDYITYSPVDSKSLINNNIRNFTDSVNSSKPKKEDDFFTETEITKLNTHIANVSKDDNYYPIYIGIRLLAITGMRVGELCALRYSDFNKADKSLRIWKMMIPYDNKPELGLLDVFGNRQIVSRCKKNSPERYIKLAPVAFDLIENLRIYNKKHNFPVGDNDYLFWRCNGQTKHKVTICTERVFDNAIRKLSKACKFDTIHSCHDFRRTYASELDSSVNQITFVQHQLGHSTPNVTRDYLRNIKAPEITESLLNEAIAKLSQTTDTQSSKK